MKVQFPVRAWIEYDVPEEREEEILKLIADDPGLSAADFEYHTGIGFNYVEGIDLITEGNCEIINNEELQHFSDVFPEDRISAPTELPRPLKVGDKVVSLTHGEGKVVQVDNNPFASEHERKIKVVYTLQNNSVWYHNNGKNTLGATVRDLFLAEEDPIITVKKYHNTELLTELEAIKARIAEIKALL